MAYGGDNDRRTFLLVMNWVFLTISLSFVIFRLVSRRMLEKNKWEIDDGFIVLAIIVIIAKTVWMTYDISIGYGRHLVDLLAEDPVNAMKLAESSYALNGLAFWTFTVPKLPVVALLARIFKVYNEHLGLILYSMLGLLVLWNTAMTIMTFKQCDPVSRNWDPMKPGKCLNPNIYQSMGYFSGSYSAFLDIVYALYAVIRVSKLQMERSSRILIAFSFSFGIPAGVVSLYKLTTIRTLLAKGDPTFETVPLDIWNCVEYTALILAAAIPMTRPIMALIGRGINRLASKLSSGWHSNASGRVAKYSDNSDNRQKAGYPQRETYKKQRSNEDILLEESRVEFKHNESVV